MRLRWIHYGRCAHPLVACVISLAALSIVLPIIPQQAQQKEKLPRVRRLDTDIGWTRDPVTGELKAISGGERDECEWSER